MLNERSKLEGVHSKLVEIVKIAAKSIPFDVLVIEGVRTKERQLQLWSQGRTKPGKIVTWTTESKHIEGKAVDIVPLVEGKIPWEDELLFVTIGNEMKKAARLVGVPIRWGFDWNNNSSLKEKGESDGPHFELKD